MKVINVMTKEEKKYAYIIKKKKQKSNSAEYYVTNSNVEFRQSLLYNSNLE